VEIQSVGFRRRTEGESGRVAAVPSGCSRRCRSTFRGIIHQRVVGVLEKVPGTSKGALRLQDQAGGRVGNATPGMCDRISRSFFGGVGDYKNA